MYSKNDMKNKLRVFDYNLLYKNYQDNLLNKLRSFGDKDELSLWVPNEDINKSISNLIDSADFQDIKIVFDKNLYNLINKDLFFKSFRSYGKIKFLEDSFSIRFSRYSDVNIKFSRESTKFKNYKIKKIRKKYIKTNKNRKLTTTFLKKNYLEALKKIKIKKTFPNVIRQNSSLVKAIYKDKSYNLELLINPNNHYIIDGIFKTQKKNTILDLFSKYFLCVAVNLPINEAKDHLLNQIEFNLRPKTIVKNKGIILKNSAGVIFLYFQEIIDKIYLDYIKKNPTKFGLNFYDYKIPKFWENLSDKERSYKINKYLKYFNKKYTNSHDLYLASISNFNKLFFNFNINLSTKINNEIFFLLESFLKDRLKVKFEVYYVNRKDENILRTL